MKQLKQQIGELETLLLHRNKCNDAVSAVSVGWHIDHILLTIYIIVNALKIAKPKTYKHTFKPSKLV